VTFGFGQKTGFKIQLYRHFRGIWHWVGKMSMSASCAWYGVAMAPDRSPSAWNPRPARAVSSQGAGERRRRASSLQLASPPVATRNGLASLPANRRARHPNPSMKNPPEYSVQPKILTAVRILIVGQIGTYDRAGPGRALYPKVAP
jgi:hypothetical protein